MSLLTSVEFLTSNASNIGELYLYMKLRFAGEGKAGYYVNSVNLTKNEKYNILPKLIEKGWCTNSKVSSHRKLCLSLNLNTQKQVRVFGNHVESIESFKGFLVALAESNQLTWALNVQNKKGKRWSQRDKTFIRKQVNVGSSLGKSKYQVRKFNENGEVYIKGRAANCILANQLNISTRTISRWRKWSSNLYDYQNFILSCDPYNPPKGSFYSKKANAFFSKDLVIKTNVIIFCNKYLSFVY